MIQQVTPQQVAERRTAGLPTLLLDVRQPEERAVAAIADSLFIPLGELPVRTNEIQPDEGALVVVYCHHGVRSLKGAAFLQACGVHPVASMAGGIEAWSLFVDPSVPRY